MNAIIGFVVVFGSIIAGFLMHGGKIGVLMQYNEFIIIGGAGIGSMIAAYGLGATIHVIKDVGGLLKGNPYTKERYSELLQLLYELFVIARKGSTMALESHIEAPHESEVLKRYPGFLAIPHAVGFMSDTLKVTLTGAIDPHDMAQAMDEDLDRYEEEANHSAHALQVTGDAMPGFGIVAAVLGVVITMGKIGGDAAEIGHSVGAALVGTFLGVLLAYGVFTPLATALTSIARSEMAYLSCISAAILAYMQGHSPMTCVEFARRRIEPALRPSFMELEQMTRKKAKEPVATS